MKTFTKIICASALVIGLVLPAFAGGYNLGITNYLPGTPGGVIGWPTNSPTTNATSFGALQYTGGTGHAVTVDGAVNFGVNYQGWCVNTGVAAAVTIQLVRATATTAGGAPLVNLVGTNYLTTYSTNGTTVTTNTIWSQNDWEMPPTGNLFVTVPIPASYTNWINYNTNFANNGTLGWVGAYYVSNTITGTGYVTNQEAFVYRTSQKVDLGGFIP